MDDYRINDSYIHYITNLSYINLLTDEKITKYFEENDITTIAVYGIGELGKKTVRRFLEAGINVKYGIDANENCYMPGLRVYSLSDELPKVDIILVTPQEYYDSIADLLIKKCNIHLARLSEFLEDILI